MIRLTLAALLVPSLGFAQELAPGVTLGAPAFTTGQGTPLFVTDSYLVVTTGGAGATLKCVDAGDGTQRSFLTTGEWIEQRLAVNRATDEMYLVSATFREPSGATRDGIQIVRTDCESRLDVLHVEDASAPDWDLALSFRAGTFQLGLLPMATDGALFLPADDGIYLWSVDSASVAPTLIAPMGAFTDTVLAAYAGREDDDPFNVRRHAAPEALTWAMRAGVALDDGSLLVRMLALNVSSESATVYLFKVERNGAISLIWRVAPGNDPFALFDRDSAASFGLETATFSEALGGFLLAASGGLGILPTDRPEVLSVYPRPVLVRTLNNVLPREVRYVNAANRRPFAWTRDGNVRTVQPISFDLTQVDFDGDGIRWTDEVVMGLDDRAVDHDGDGFHDGIERVLFGTDPGSAASAPNVSLDKPTVGFSARLGDWLFNQEPLRSESSFGYGVICPSTDRCLDGRRRPSEIQRQGTTAFENASATPDGRIVQLFEGGRPVEWFLADGLSYSANGISEVFRETTAGSFPVLQYSRTDCPFMNDPLDTARCMRPEERIPDGNVGLRLGYSPPNESIILGLNTLSRGWVALGTTNVSTTEVFADGRVFQGWDPEQIIPLDPENGSAYLIEAFRDEPGANASRRWYLADANLVPREQLRLWPSSFALGNGVPIGGRFDRGPMIRMRAAFSKPASDFGGGGACTMGAMGIFTCGQPMGTPEPFALDWHSLMAQLVVVDPGLQPGETLVAHPGFRDGLLSRITQEGAYVPWLTIRRLNRLLEAETPIVALEMRDIAVAPDATKVCMVDEMRGANPPRVWEISVADGRPSTVRIAYEDLTEPPLACGYDDAGRLHWAVPDGLVPETGSRIDTSVEQPRHLHRVDGQWVLIGDLDGHEQPEDASSEAVCIDDAGAVTELGALTAMSDLDGIAHLLDAFGALTTVLSSDVCSPASDAPRESALVPSPTGYVGPRNLWSFLFEQIFQINTSVFGGQVDWRVEHATLVARPDGALLVFPGFSWFGRGPRPRPWVWWLRPSYWPEDPGNRIEALDPLRREEDFANVLTEEIFTVPAAARVPGAANWPDESYEWFDRPPPRPRDPMTTSGSDAGVSDGGSVPDPGGDDNGEGCGCAAAHPGDFGAAFAVLLFLFALRRRDA